MATASGSIFRYRPAAPPGCFATGRLREMGLGPLHTVTLAEARQKAMQCRKMRLDGLDPIDERRASRAASHVSAARGNPHLQRLRREIHCGP
jgi:hypothetical protein